MTGIVLHCVGDEEDAARHQDEVVAGVSGSAGDADGFAHGSKGQSRHAAFCGGKGQLADGKCTRHGGLGVVVGGAVVGKHLQDAAEVFVVDAAIDEVQVVIGYLAEFLEHGSHAVGIVCGLADGEGMLVHFLPPAVETCVLHHAGDAVAYIVRRNSVAHCGQQLQGLEEGCEVFELITAAEGAGELRIEN